MSGSGNRYDVVISGGGLIGASLAAALIDLPVRVALAEAVPFESSSQPSFDERTIALSRSSQKILEATGVWSGVREHSCPIRDIHVSERGRFGTAVISAEQQGVEALGYVVGSRILGAALWARIGGAPNIDVFCPGSLASDGVAGDLGITLRLDSPGMRGPIDGRLLVIAEGARSNLRSALGIAATEHSYGQTAIVGNVAIDGCPARATAYERFTAEGPIALLPYLDGRFVFVMARSSAQAQGTLDLDEPAFIELLQSAFGRRLGRFVRLGRRSAYPLALVEAERVTAPRVAVIGNAAHGLHPVAAQGYNLGLRDVATLAEVTADAIRAGEDPGAQPVLKHYESWRRRDQRNVVRFTDGLIRLFDLPLAPTGAARGMGLLLFDLVPGAKHALARHAMGMGGRLTRLARGLPL